MTARPPLDPEIAAALARTPGVVTALHPGEIAGLRARAQPPTEADVTAHGRRTLERLRIDGADGHGIDVAVARPADARGALPVLVHVHGGGLVAGTLLDDLPAAAELAGDLGMAVVSTDYRLAPEHPFPAAIDDVVATVRWVAADGPAHGLDPDRVVIGGVSAGGGLAAAAALRLRDEDGPAVLGQLLVCPMLDEHNDSSSAAQMAGAGAWDRTANETGWSAYLGRERRDVSPWASAARATDLSGLPPAFLDVGSAETFRDEVQRYAAGLWAAGGDAELHVWAGGVHGFDALAPDAAVSRAARAARASWLRRILARAEGLALPSGEGRRRSAPAPIR
ncbi:alpha/beta hydrolase [Microbacterium sp. 10M-3C3]|uniref:alpha/beta hydrolase n=1 Tax=Microbacterium sp. 10M-3C3 TaxID=2483401 RepID=UPI000F642F4E|nr:alpha/beta hydrolase [Microbacterium sp. 10M-3C3]